MKKGMVIQFKLSISDISQTFWINDYLLFCLVHKFRNLWLTNFTELERKREIEMERMKGKES